MELIYSMRRKPLKCEPPHFETASDPEVIRPIIRLSSSNIVAFSSPTALTDVEGDTWGGHVYVCDLDTPWNSYRVTTTEHPVSALQWDQESNKLLVCTTAGDAQVYGQKDHQLNEWTMLYSSHFPGEHIIECTFFHNGRRIVVADKKPDAPLTEKYQLMRSAPTLKGFGGAPCAGICVVSSQGAVSVTLAGGEVTHSHRDPADHVCAADIKHNNGNILIACVCKSGSSRARVRAYVCRVTQTQIQVQPLASIHLNTAQTPTSIAWCFRDDSDSILLSGANLSLWKLTERSHTVHKLFAKGPAQGNTTPGSVQKPNTEVFNTLVWVQTATWSAPEGSVPGTRVARCPVAGPGGGRAVLVSHCALHLVAYGNPHFVSTCQVSTSGSAEPVPAASPPKKSKYNPGTKHSPSHRPVVCDACISECGAVVIAVDTHAQLHLYKLPLNSAGDMAASVVEVTSMLEYCMVSSVDCLDVLYSLNPTTAETVYERLTESFQRQPAGFQQYYYHSCLKIRIALCRCSPALSRAASWLTSLQMCLALQASAAAPHALDDKQTDDDKALVGLESKPDLCMDSWNLHALRRPLQRVIHLTATVLHSVCNHPTHGYDFTTDPTAISLLRKLLSITVACLNYGEGFIRPLARLSAHNYNFKQDFIDECQSVSSLLCTSRVWECLPRIGVSTPTSRPKLLYLEYGVEPEVLKFAPEPPSIGLFDVTPTLEMDTIRYTYLGGGGRVPKARACGRCGARGAVGAVATPAGGAGAAAVGGSGPAAGAGTRAPGGGAAQALQRAYDARFIAKCRCGGRWSVISNV